MVADAQHEVPVGREYGVRDGRIVLHCCTSELIGPPVPDSRHAVGAGSDDVTPIGMELSRGDGVGVLDRLSRRLARSRVPDSQELVIAGSDEPSAVWREIHIVDPLAMLNVKRKSPVSSSPERYAVVEQRREGPPVGRKTHKPQRTGNHQGTSLFADIRFRMR